MWEQLLWTRALLSAGFCMPLQGWPLLIDNHLGLVAALASRACNVACVASVAAPPEQDEALVRTASTCRNAWTYSDVCAKLVRTQLGLQAH